MSFRFKPTCTIVKRNCWLGRKELRLSYPKSVVVLRKLLRATHSMVVIAKHSLRGSRVIAYSYRAEHSVIRSTAWLSYDTCHIRLSLCLCVVANNAGGQVKDFLCSRNIFCAPSIIHGPINSIVQSIKVVAATLKFIKYRCFLT